MNYMKQVAQMLGVEIGEEFNIEGYVDNLRFKFTEDDIGYFHNGEWNSTSCYLYDLLNGKLKLVKLSKPILDEKEKEYLSYVIRPFRSEIISIYKQRSDSHRNEWININFKNDMEMIFPSFRNGTMYKGMELDKNYTLEELGL